MDFEFLFSIPFHEKVGNFLNKSLYLLTGDDNRIFYYGEIQKVKKFIINIELF